MFYLKNVLTSQMELLNKQTLSALGISLSGYPVKLPLYVRTRVVLDPEPSQFRHLVDTELSFQHLCSLVLQIVDYSKFQRWHETESLLDISF